MIPNAPWVLTQCSGVTAAGNRCLRVAWATYGGYLCRQHLHQSRGRG